MQQLPSNYKDTPVREYSYGFSISDSIRNKMLFNKQHHGNPYSSPQPDNPLNGPQWDRKSAEVTTGWRPFYSSFLSGHFDKNK